MTMSAAHQWPSSSSTAWSVLRVTVCALSMTSYPREESRRINRFDYLRLGGGRPPQGPCAATRPSSPSASPPRTQSATTRGLQPPPPVHGSSTLTMNSGAARGSPMNRLRAT
jgi:hypothetical protein